MTRLDDPDNLKETNLDTTSIEWGFFFPKSIRIAPGWGFVLFGAIMAGGGIYSCCSGEPGLYRRFSEKPKPAVTKPDNTILDIPKPVSINYIPMMQSEFYRI